MAKRIKTDKGRLIADINENAAKITGKEADNPKVPLSALERLKMEKKERVNITLRIHPKKREALENDAAGKLTTLSDVLDKILGDYYGL